MHNKTVKKLIIPIIVFCATILIGVLYCINSWNTKYTKELNEKLLILMKDSNIIKEKIGEVKTIYKDKADWFEKFDDNGSYWANYKITTNTNEEFNIKIILNSKKTKGIYAYEINGKILYEEIVDDANINLRYFIIR